MTHEKQRHDIHQELTNHIIDLLDKVNEHNYEAPFSGFVHQGIPTNPTTQASYQGVNILSLWFNQHTRNFSSNHWATFKQWKEKGASVKKGEKGSRVIFYKTLVKEEENKKGEIEEQKIPMLKLYSVFNANQVEGFDDPNALILPQQDRVERQSLIEEFCVNTGAEIKCEDLEAFYNAEQDYINMPKSKQFNHSEKISATDHYYSTLLHELTHWTGADKRLAREGIAGKVDKEKYAFEELVAELGSAFLCAQLNINQGSRDNHAVYLKSWLKALKADKTLIFKASAQAAKATDYLNNLQDKLEPTS